ncbi:putative V-type proton ATPase subunit H [Canna indica]|uniref:V-type proton ATPase subunit H n=1 Tax=Canna indica TaxID=4628 RepID=A0AAQ3K3L3_9LILI|nr:putative V-type proton ATPase subunit H [Canna indica]
MAEMAKMASGAIRIWRGRGDERDPLLWWKALSSMDHAEIATQEVLKRDIPWEAYMSTKLITGTHLQLLRLYVKKSENQRVVLLDENGVGYVQVFLNILHNISNEETVEYVLALIDEMLTGGTWCINQINLLKSHDINLTKLFLFFAANPKKSRLFHDKSLSSEDIYGPFLTICLLIVVLDLDSHFSLQSFRWLHEGNWFIKEKSSKILTLIVSARPRLQHAFVSIGESSHSKDKISNIDTVLKELLDWLCSQLKAPSHSPCSVPLATTCLATLLREPCVRVSFIQVDGVKLLIPLISPASTQQSIQLLYETCLCIWLLSYYDAAADYLATTRVLPKLVEVVKGSTKEKVVRVIILTLRNLLPRAACGAQMIDLGLPQIVQSLKAQAWSDEILCVLVTILDTSSDATALAVACYDLFQFIQYHPAGRIIVSNLKVKDRVMKLMNHENAEVTKNALLCIQRLFLGAKYASFLQS